MQKPNVLASEGKVDAISGRVSQKEKRLEAASTLFRAFDPSESIGTLTGNLPHWRQDGATHFVTFRTADSLPQGRLQQWLEERAEWLQKNPEPHNEAQRREYWECFPARFQHWLDQGYGACELANPKLRGVVESTLKHFHGDRYELRDQIVMPNHVHVIVTPFGEHMLSSIVQSWKSFTALKINKALNRHGSFWQKESFDHIVRNMDSLDKFHGYIDENRKCRRGFQPRIP
jgi:type I restriction enzyme R subunit